MLDGEPDLESLTMAFFETRDAGNLYYLKGHTRDTAKYAYMQQVGVSSTIVHRSCLSRRLERVIRVELCGQCRIYARRQGTSFWFILYQTTYVSLFNYNTLMNIPNPVDIIPSPNPNILLSSAIPAAELALSSVHNNFPPITSYLLVSARTLALVHAIQIQNKDLGTSVRAYINAHSGAFMGLTEFVSKVDYRVLPIMKETSLEGFDARERLECDDEFVGLAQR